jgi:hypothetical protein
MHNSRGEGVRPIGAPRYVVQWRAPIMPAPAFWYFETSDEALDLGREMARRCEVRVCELSEGGKASRELFAADGRAKGKAA